MIPAFAVREFKERAVDDHRWLKECSHAELDQILDSIRPRLLYPAGLRLHQKVMVILGLAYPTFSFWADMGSGKTIVALILLRHWMRAGEIDKAIVFVLSDKAFLSWERQFERWDIGIPRVALEGSSAEKWAQHDRLDKGIVLVSYAGAVAMLSTKVPAKTKSGADSKKKIVWQLDPSRLDRFGDGFGGLVMDESTKGGHHTSLTHKMLRSLGKTMPIRYALAGRPFGRDPTLLWGQQYLVDRGSSLGETLGIFRAAFFKAKLNRFSGFNEFAFDKNHQPELSRMLQHRSITYGSDECVDLPPLVSERVKLHLPEEAGAYLKRVVDGIIAARGNLRAMNNAFMQMRQLSSGFLGFKDDETGERASIEFGANPKREWTVDMLSQLDGNKAVVFYQFTYAGRKLVEALKAELGFDAAWLWSGTKDNRATLKRFMNDKDCPVIVINNDAGAFSLDGLQEAANYTFFYESPVSPITREQAERRVRRDGQKHKTVFQFDPIVIGTMDERIPSFHAEGRDLVKSLLHNPLEFISETLL